MRMGLIKESEGHLEAYTVGGHLDSTYVASKRTPVNPQGGPTALKLTVYKF